MSTSLLKTRTRFACACALLLSLTGCGGGNGNSSGVGGGGGGIEFTVNTSASLGGSIAPTSATVASGNTTSFTVTPDSGYAIDTVSGCSGSLSGNTYTTGAITADCTVTASFKVLYTVSATAGSGGSIAPTSATVASGNTTSFTVTPDSGYAIDTVSGCGGSLSGNTYTTGAITADCTVTASFVVAPPATAAAPTLNFAQTKLFRFTWNDVNGATFYRLLENPDGVSGFSQIGPDIPAGIELFDHEVPLYARVNARYILQSCNAAGCTDSSEVSVSGNLIEAVGYFKAHNTDVNDSFGYAVALSGDGGTLAVGAYLEDSNATGIDGDQTVNTANDAGAVYVFIRNGNGSWVQQAYIKASNTDPGDNFGHAVALSADGNTLVVGANGEGSISSIIGAYQADNSAPGAGAAYVFTRSGTDWSQQAYIKPSYAGADDQFGYAVSLSADGNTLAVGAPFEDSNATGTNNFINNGGNDNSVFRSGAVYVFTRSGTVWEQQTYVKASNTGANDNFGRAVALSADGDTLAVGAPLEDSIATGIDGDQTNDPNNLFDAGAVYVFVRRGGGWTQEAYIKASNVGESYYFGRVLMLSADGRTLAVGSPLEYSVTNSTAGAVYIFTLSGTTWSQQAYITKPTNTPGEFGSAVALSADGNTLAVGATQDRGYVHLFTRDGEAWGRQIFNNPNLDFGDHFGGAVSLSADASTLAIGAYEEDSAATGINGDQSDDSAENAGAVYLY